MNSDTKLQRPASVNSVRSTPAPFDFAVLVPTLNAGAPWRSWIKSIKAQTFQPSLVLVLDSESDDDTVLQAEQAGFQIHSIQRKSFAHGATRQIGVELIGDSIDCVVCLTQDALLADRDTLEKLVAVFHDSTVACAYGRQLPHADATPLAAHARLFNYPVDSHLVGLADKARLGIKTCFVSNSFAAYRVADLRALGGFPADVILGEDMSVAARMLMAGRRVAYVADACAFHSHNYTLLQDFRRYFDTGVFHARNPWLLQTFGSVSGEGMRFVHSEIKYLQKNAPSLIPSAMTRTLAKWLGYKLGMVEAVLPLPCKRWCSMHRAYWNTKT